MKRAIKNLITRLLWDSISTIIEETKETPVVVFWIDGYPVEAKNMGFVPPINSEVKIFDKGGSKMFKVEIMEVSGETGMQIDLYGKFI